MASTEAANQVSVKLLVHKKQNKVLFAEAGKDFVDVLFGFLTLPLGSIVQLVGEESNIPPVRVGSLSTLYESVAKLEKECLSSDTSKQMLLHPRNAMEIFRRQLKLDLDGTASLKYFTSKTCHCHNWSLFRNLCCRHGRVMDAEELPPVNGIDNGFVSETSSFIVCDNLNVMPNVLDKSVPLLKDIGINNMDEIEVLIANVTRKEVLDLLKCALLSDTPLTDVFLKKQHIGCYTQNNLSNVELSEVAIVSGMKLDVTVFVRKSNGKIVLAQGDENFADFVLSFLTFPLGGVLKMLQRYSSSLTCLDQLYKSLPGLIPGRFFISESVKVRLVDVPCAYGFSINPFRPLVEWWPVNYLFYSILVELSDYRTIGFTGFCRRPSMFILTDDLIIRPMTSISVLSYLDDKNIPFGDLEQKVVSIGVKEGLAILKASLFSTSALTDGLNELIRSF